MVTDSAYSSDESRLEMEQQDARQEHHEELHGSDNDAEDNTETDLQMEIPKPDNAAIIETTKEMDIDDSDLDSDQSCPICMDLWTSSGEHRLCCLKCGHLFGHSCILRWLQVSCTSTNRRCPQCNRKAALKDIRMLYAKKLTSIDTSELSKLKEELSNMSAKKNRIEMELSKYYLRQKLYEQQLTSMKTRIAELESQQLEMSTNLNQNISKYTNKKFHLERSIDICKDGACRVLDYNPCVGFDKCAKLMDVQNNVVVHTYQAEFPLWSCCWSGDNPNMFFAGAQNGSIMQFDIRQTSGAVEVLDSPGDRSPVVSLATVPPNPGSGLSTGGFIACRLNTCYAYEQKAGKYIPKQIFLEGPFVSVRYDEKNNHALISSRPNARQPHARHIVCTIEKVAAHQESTSSVSLWSISTGKQVHSLPVSYPVIDMCAFEVSNNLYLATLSKKKIRFYSHG
ncbi:hypothetical protein KM043_017191 [Ampulex compressa]|nr:hypothetical protein KM043_017191 [Ampulex compressa]